MCGICGFVSEEGCDPAVLGRMADRAAHRGPDDEGYWIWDGESGAGVFVEETVALAGRSSVRAGLGHRRLAIIDLTRAGRQPMQSADGSCWIAMNGEIYNYVELRQELVSLGHRFLTRTDTEVALAAFQEWGHDCFKRFNGMWALAIVDTRKRTLTLCRDRLGVKPLYTWMGRRSLFFCSEIKQLLEAPGFRFRPNPDAVAEYIDTGYEEPPHSFFQGVVAFRAGHVATISLDALEEPAPRSYWDPERLHEDRMAPDEAARKCREIFADAVRLRLRSDVPVGVCLSGGLDSSAIAAAATLIRDRQQPIHSFSALFEGTPVDETPHVAAMVAHCRAVSHCVHPTPREFVECQDAFLYHLDEPPGSFSSFASSCVMRAARQHGVPVLLNGQGGDELFGGYWPAYLQHLRRLFPRNPLSCAWHLVGAALPGGNRELLRQAFLLWQRYRVRRSRRNRAVLAPACRDSGFTLHRNWALEAQSLSDSAYRMNEIRRVHLPRLLRNEDRNSMAFAVEGRYPFLDHRLVEFAITLPPELNFRRGWNKWLIREGMGNLLPATVRYRRDKIGFEAPDELWGRGELRTVLERWVKAPSAALGEFVRIETLGPLLSETLERQGGGRERFLLLLRLYFLDRWLAIFASGGPQAGLRETDLAARAKARRVGA